MKKKRGLFSYLKTEVFGTNSNVVAGAWLTAVTLIVGLGIYAGSPTRSFLGIANSQESDISFEYPTSVKAIHVIPGQKVKKGELLFEVSSEKKASQYFFAHKAGVIGNVNYKRGDKVPAYGPVITISPESPTQITGFIREEMSSQAKVGDFVKVRPMTTADIEVQGRIVSFGSRIIEIPSRLENGILSKNVYGREVIIQIPGKNKLMAGEKVVISPRSKSFIGVNTALADIETLTGKKDLDAQLIMVPPSINLGTMFEPSGLVYVSDLKKYLVVSDDTDKKRSPYLFLMSEDGELDPEYLSIPGVEELSDMESISSDNVLTYLMTSLSLTSSGKFKDRQNQLVRFKFEGGEFKSVEKITLGEILRSSLQSSFDPDLRKIVSMGLDRIDVEAQSVRNGEMYLILKNPVLENNRSMILKISNLEALFEGETKAKISMIGALEFDPSVSQYQQQVTDLAFMNGQMVVTTTCLGKKCGGVWKVPMKSMKAELLGFYKKLQPEGVTYNSEKSLLMVTFDQGSDPALFTTIRQ